MSGPEVSWFDHHLFRAHPLWVPPDWAIAADLPLRLDARRWIAQCREANIESLLFVTKQHDGRCVWPTRLDAPGIGHGFTGDFLGEICHEAKQVGLSIVAYYSSAIDTAQALRHPDWRFVDPAGEPSLAYGYVWMCLNSPYGEFCLQQIEEIVANYEVATIWLDIFALGRPRTDCWCVHCQQKYAERHGGDLRAIVGTPESARWKIDCLEEHLVRLRGLIARYRPETMVSFNGAGPGYRRHPEAGIGGRRLLAYVDFCSDEGHRPNRESSYARYLRNLGKPFEILAANGAGNQWVNFAVKPSPLLTLDAAVVCAQGGKFTTGISALANGSLPEGELAEIGKTGSWLAARRPYLTGQTLLGEIAILCQPYRLGQFERAFRPPEAPPPAALPEGSLRRYRPPDRHVLTNGLETALIEGHLQVDLLDDESPLDNRGYRLLVLPGDAIITPDLAERIRQFVAAGGCLLAEGHAGLLDEQQIRRNDFILADVFGVHFAGYAGAWDASYVYLHDVRLRAGLPNGPILLDGPALRLRLDGAQPLAFVGTTIGGERTPDHHVGGRNNPPGPPTDLPAITRQQYGRGSVIYVAVSLGENISAWRNVEPWTKQLAVNLAALLVPKPLLRTNAPSGVEVVLARQPGHYLVYLFNHYLTHEAISGRRDAPRLAEIEISLDTAQLGPIRSAWLAPEHAPLSLRRESNHTTIFVPSVTIAEIIVAEISS